MTMRETPWDTDRELTISSVRQLTMDQFTDLCPVELQFLGSGWDNDVYLANDRWIFRFPRHAEVASRLGFEASVAAAFHRRLATMGVSVPIVERWGEASEAFPHAFTVSRRVPGQCAVSARIETLSVETFTDSLGRMLERLHATPRNGIPTLPREPEGAAEWLAEALRVADDLEAKEGPALHDCFVWLRRHPDVPPPPEMLRVLHNDICPDHLFVSPDSGQLVGLLDVSDAAWGDPALDFVIFPMWLRADAVRKVLDAYGAAADAAFVSRLRFLARVKSLKWLYDAHRRNGDIAKHRRWVLNAFSF